MAMDHETRALLSRVLAALGVTMVLPACSPRLVDEGDDEAAEDESSATSSEGETASESGTSSSSDTIESSSDSSEDGETSEGDDPVEILDIPEDACMGEWPQWFESDAEIPQRCLDGEDPSFLHMVCFSPPADTTCEDPGFSEACLNESVGGCSELACPTTIDGACCYMVEYCPPGRGFLVAGEPTSAARTCDPTWARSRMPDLAALDPETRASLADAWAGDALAEHASVASFARFTAQLLALAAPPELVAASVRASADEVRHAQRCFGLASAYAGAAIGPGAIALQACMGAGPPELHAVALDLAIEGCIVETVSTLLLAAARDRARDAGVRAVLRELVRDEEDHVVLAWQALAWMVGRGGPELRRSLAATFERAETWVRSEPIERAGDPELLRAHGYLSARERRAIALDVIDRLVIPAARALLAAPTLKLGDQPAGQ